MTNIQTKLLRLLLDISEKYGAKMREAKANQSGFSLDANGEPIRETSGFVVSVPITKANPALWSDIFDKLVRVCVNDLHESDQWTTAKATINARHFLNHLQQGGLLYPTGKPIFGAWSHNGKLFADVGYIVADKETALNLAKQWQQLAVWDIANNCEIFMEGNEKND